MANSLQRELDSFSKDVMGGEFNIRQVTKSAFTQARAKLDPSAFKELSSNVVPFKRCNSSCLIWSGFLDRILSIVVNMEARSKVTSKPSLLSFPIIKSTSRTPILSRFKTIAGRSVIETRSFNNPRFSSTFALLRRRRACFSSR